MTPFAKWLRRPVAVLTWAVALLVAGTWVALQIPLEWAPQVELPEVRITASWPGAATATTAPRPTESLKPGASGQISSI